MLLEELKEIEASDFPIGKLIMIISKNHDSYWNHKLEEYEIKASQLHLLFEINNENEINQDKIANRCNLNKGAVARNIQKLESEELILREVDENNRRQNKISLTNKGKKIVNKSLKALNNWEKEVSNNNSIDIKVLKYNLKEIAIKSIEMNKNYESEE